jgi:alkaline phosphatase D
MGFEPNGIDLESVDETKGIGRRTFLMGALAAGAAASAPVNYAAAARKKAGTLAKQGSFDLGVAAGFPRPRGIMLWTHLGDVKENAKVRLLVAKDRGFSNVVEERLVNARPRNGHTARTFVNGLDPHEQYFYRFATEESKSEVGRFRTAPPLKSKEKIRIAFYSCQNWEAGYFNAQLGISREKDIDLVVGLGDYMYEYSDEPERKAIRRDATGRNGDGDSQFLDEYRDKYRLYKSDRYLRRMHAAHPFIAVWDDHEVEDNHADGKPSSAQQDPNKTNLRNYPRRVSYLQRRANGYRAFFEHMPRARFKGDRDRIYEDYRLGSMVDLFLTDERQYRDQQPCNDEILQGCLDGETPRTLLGERQKNWLLRGLKASPARWKLWGTQLMLMALRAPAPGVPAQVDAWDGYAYERGQILDYILDNGIENVVAFTGDIHTFFAGTAYTRGDETAPGSRPAVPEFVGGSATSLGIPEATGLNDTALNALAGINSHVDFYDFRQRGYGVLEISANELTCTLKATNALLKGQPSLPIAKFRVLPGQRIPERLSI